VAAERARRRELAELVPDHLLGHEHGRTIRFSPRSFIPSMRLSSRSSTKGPFFDDLDT
jgi:hypothetical protein